MNHTYDLDEVLQILKNVGADISCGECCCIAFTGMSTTRHTCKDSNNELCEISTNLPLTVEQRSNNR
jgi:hypothetical protein